MGLSVANDSSETGRLLRRARAGDRLALSELLERHRDRLRRMVDLRLDWRLRGRIDPSDVLQEAYLHVARRLDDYLKDPKLPPFLWLRLTVCEWLTNLHRHHLGIKMREAGRE